MGFGLPERKDPAGQGRAPGSEELGVGQVINRVEAGTETMLKSSTAETKADPPDQLVLSHPNHLLGSFYGNTGQVPATKELMCSGRSVREVGQHPKGI